MKMTFERLREKINKNNEKESLKSVSFDFKIFGIYHVAMMVLFAARPFDNAKDQAFFAPRIQVVSATLLGWFKG